MNHRIFLIGAEITPSGNSTFVGGHVNTVVRLCRGLSDLGWEIHLITTPSRLLGSGKFSFPWAKTYLIKAGGSHNSPRYLIEFFAKAIKAIEYLSQGQSFDLIHAHSGYFSLASIPVFARKRIGVPALFSLYCPASLFPSRLPIDRYGVKILSAGLDRIIAVTNNVKKSLTRYGVSEKKIEVIPSCVDEQIFNPSVLSARVRKGSRMASKNQTVLFVGNVHSTKGLDVFLKSAELILHRNPRAKFVVTLHEPDEIIERVKAICSSRFGLSVSVKGLVRDMAGLIASSDVVVAPFRNTEGISDIPLIVLEAMAIGKPVVASRLEGITEVIRDGDNGLLVKPGQASELSEGILALFSDSKLRKEISQRGLSSVKQFTCVEISRRVSDLYTEIIKGAG